MEDKYLDIEEGNQTELVDGEREQLNPTVNQEAKPIYVADPNRTDIVKAAIENVLNIDGKLPSNEKGLLVPAYYKKDIENICIDAILKAIEEGTIHVGGGEVVEGGFTVKFLDKDDNAQYIFSSLSGGNIKGLSPYPSKQGYLFDGYTTVKGELSTRVNFPITVTEDKTYYPYFTLGEYCVIDNLGSENPNDVIFTKSSNFPSENQLYEEVVVGGNHFAKFTKWYKKIETDENGNVKKIYISQAKQDEDYHLYDCFYDENGYELDYILIGQYCMSSTTTANSVDATSSGMTIGSGRSLARAKGTGYQIMDAAMQIFWRDLALACSEKINFNNGAGVSSYLGLKRMNETGWWIDGVVQNNGAIYYSNKPSKYVNEPNASTEGYDTFSYSCPTTGSGNSIKNLGYDPNHPTINFPREVSGSNDYSKYYCDAYYYASGNHPIRVDVGYPNAYRGLFAFVGNDVLSFSFGIRLCYKPITE